ncbi:MAG: YihA family ribosome biogenesis GTP-binding protein [Desulfobacterales bacterium]|nr:YihA family ribosome biogenesis GTP-binding protein [Desulfobacterales bacterium]
MLVKSAEFVTSAVKPPQYPPAEKPEIAFAGRSNVGKSSLINTLVNRKRLVKTSSTPGRTQLINFFDINGAVHFVDLPGYGYAKVPRRVKKTWGPMIERYIQTRETLRGVVMLMDIRRTPGEEEISLVQWLDGLGIPCVPILTKADKLSKTKRIKHRRAISEATAISIEDLILFSAKTRLGKDAVWKVLDDLTGMGEGRGGVS